MLGTNYIRVKGENTGMKEVMEFGKRLLISIVGALTILTITIVLIEWKNIVDPVFTCVVCKKDFWWFPHRVAVMGQEIEICRSCARTIREVGQQLGSLFG